MTMAEGHQGRDIETIRRFLGDSYGDLNHGAACILIEDEAGDGHPRIGLVYDGCFNLILAGIADVIGELMLSVGANGLDPSDEFRKFMGFLKETVTECIEEGSTWQPSP